ncbi:MAG: hypothetical protein ACE1Y4_02455 [Lysobacterales bacterium]|nr:SEL1-like repeat protein [Alphaproteobacteria bacterium]
MLAEQGDVNSQFALGSLYAAGEGVEQNEAEAIKWFQLAAQQGFAAARRIGQMCAAQVEVRPWCMK